MRTRFAFSIGGLWAFGAALLCGQTTAQITGRITDASSAIVGGASVTVADVNKGTKHNVISNESGYYTVSRLDLGSYEVTVEKSGFKLVTRSGIKLDVNESARIDFVLDVGEITQRIEVSGESSLLETNAALVGTVVSQEKISDLPLNGRNFSQLVLLTPGASPIRVTQGGGTQKVGIVAQPAINGQSSRSNAFTLDGVYNNAHYVGTYAVAPSIDSLNQFKVQSHSDQSEFGGVTGSVINIASKSGTNQFHGSLYEFLRNDKLDAKGYFAASKQALRQNQFGASLGGPVIKNKTFFFFSYEGYRQVLSSNNLSIVPTPQELNGDFSATSPRIFNPFSTRENPQRPGTFIRDPFANNQIPASLLDRSTRAWADTILPKPIVTGVPGFNARNTDPSRSPANNYSFRIDHNISTQDMLWFRYNWGTQNTVTPGTFPGSRSLVDTPAKNLGVSYTHLFGPNTLVSALFGFSGTSRTTRASLTAKNLFPDYFPTFPPNPPANPDATAPSIGVSGSFSTNGGGAKDGPQNGWQYRSDLTHTFGAHSLKFGGEFVRQPWATKELNNSISFNTPQTADLNNLGNTGLAMASFMLGVLESTELANSDYALESELFNLYVQDSWKATSRLTVNLAMRWDLLRNPDYTADFQSTWDFNTGKFIVGTSKPPACTPEQLKRVSGALAAPCLQDPNNPYLAKWVDFTGNSKIRKDDYKMFGPRFGLAYRINPKTVLRGGFGITYDLMAGVNQQAQNGAVDNANWPGARGTTVNANDTFVEVTARDPFGGRNPLINDPTPADAIAFYYDPKFQNPYSEQWNFEIQREWANNQNLSVAYVGSHNVRLSIGSEYNTALTPGPGPAAPRRLWPHAPSTGWDRSIGQSSYHSLQVKNERRFAKGLAYLLSYTWSKSIDVASSGQYREGLSLQNPYDPNSSRSVSGFDVPHLFSTAVIYDLPFGAGKPWLNQGIVARIFGNWQVNGIAQLRSGQPFTPQMNVDIANIGALTNPSRARPDLIGNPVLSNPTPLAWFNTKAFASPKQYTFGSAGRNILRSDGVTNLDLSLFRQDRLTERVRMEFRVESFNVLNHPDFGLPAAVFTAGTFGRVTSTVSTARQNQFGLKLIF